jgi:hypothetical protein
VLIVCASETSRRSNSRHNIGEGKMQDNAEHAGNCEKKARYTFTSDINQWMHDNARAIAEHLWCPNLETGWKAWIYPGKDGEVLCSYNTQNTAPSDSEIGDQVILPIWNDIDDEGSPFDDDYTPEDYIADHISNGRMDIPDEF